VWARHTRRSLARRARAPVPRRALGMRQADHDEHGNIALASLNVTEVRHIETGLSASAGCDSRWSCLRGASSLQGVAAPATPRRGAGRMVQPRWPPACLVPEKPHRSRVAQAGGRGMSKAWARPNSSSTPTVWWRAQSCSYTCNARLDARPVPVGSAPLLPYCRRVAPKRWDGSREGVTVVGGLAVCHRCIQRVVKVQRHSMPQGGIHTG